MKKTKLVVLTLFLLLALGFAFILAGGWKDDTPSIVGGWETEATIINPYEDVGDAKGMCQYYFYEDFTGVRIDVALTTTQSPFTYQLNEDEVSLSFDSGEAWTFPYHLEEDVLVLTQNQTDIPYQRIK